MFPYLVLVEKVSKWVCKMEIVSGKCCVIFLLHPCIVFSRGWSRALTPQLEVFFIWIGSNRQTETSISISRKLVIEKWFWITGVGFCIFVSRVFYIWVEMRLYPSLFSKVWASFGFFFLYDIRDRLETDLCNRSWGILQL